MDKSEIVLHTNATAIGDNICLTPLLRKLYYTYKQKISIYSQNTTVFERNPYVNKLYNKKYDERNKIVHKTFRVNEKLYKDEDVTLKHNAMHITQYHASSLGFQLLPNECHLNFFPEEAILNFNLPEKYIVLHPSLTWASRTWEKQKWQQLIDKLNKLGFFIVVLGKNDFSNGLEIFNLEIKNGIDLTDKTTLSESWHIINNSQAIILMDTGLLHFAGTTDANIIHLTSSINPIFRAPYRKGRQDYKYYCVGGECKKYCASDIKYGLKEHGNIHGIPPLRKCLEGKRNFDCHPEVNKVICMVNKILENKKKILFVAPHLSTGGMPEFLRKRIEKVKDYFDIYVVEFTCYGEAYVIQRNKIINLVGEDKFFTLGYLNENNEDYISNRLKLMDVIKKIKPDIIHLDESPELFDFNGFPIELAEKLYDNNRDYCIIETSHNAKFQIDKKKWMPDKFLFVSPWHMKKCPENINKSLIEYPVEPKERPDRNTSLKNLGLNPDYKHVLNIGLFTPGKNQKLIVEIANKLKDEKIMFHFVGNMASNFKEYWEPLKKDKPDNCVFWGEREDVDRFYSSMDLFLFPSLYELNPICIKEALSWDMNLLINNLEQYCEIYNDNKNVYYLKNNIQEISQQVKELLEG